MPIPAFNIKWMPLHIRQYIVHDFFYSEAKAMRSEEWCMKKEKVIQKERSRLRIVSVANVLIKHTQTQLQRSKTAEVWTVNKRRDLHKRSVLCLLYMQRKFF
jgi:hypothetical protein